MSSPAISLQHSSRQVWSAVLAMSLCAFALVASEFLPVSLLTPIASDLSLTEGQAGQAISISGFLAVITSLLLSSLTQGIDRKPVLLATTVLMLVSGAVAFLFMGQFTLFTYLRPFLETVTHVDVPTLSLLLLIIGMAGLVGTTFVGSFVSRNLNRILIGIPLIMTATAFAVIAVASWVVPVAALLGLWGLVATCAPVGWFTWLAKALPHNAEAGGGLMVAVIQLAITAGATAGGVLYDGMGYQATFIASSAFLFIATTLSVITNRR